MVALKTIASGATLESGMTGGLLSIASGFYIKNGLDFRVRDDLNLNSPGDFESTQQQCSEKVRKAAAVGLLFVLASPAIARNTKIRKLRLADCRACSKQGGWIEMCIHV